MSRLTIEFTIPGAAVAKGRPRHGNGRTWTPTKTAQAEDIVGWHARKAIPRPLAGPLRLEVTTYHAIPVGTSKARREAMLAGSERPAKRPDVDNLAKLVLDALNRIAYQDDNQVVELRCSKHYGDPRTVVGLTQL